VARATPRHRRGSAARDRGQSDARDVRSDREKAGDEAFEPRRPVVVGGEVAAHGLLQTRHDDLMRLDNDWDPKTLNEEMADVTHQRFGLLRPWR
jgi:hypothetical protein